MSAPVEEVREGRCGECLRLFYVCGPCERGQEYCSGECQETGVTRLKREANARHQKSPEGKLDHRDHNREYRARLRASVTDVGSREVASAANRPVSTDPAAPISGGPEAGGRGQSDEDLGGVELDVEADAGGGDAG